MGISSSCRVLFEVFFQCRRLKKKEDKPSVVPFYARLVRLPLPRMHIASNVRTFVHHAASPASHYRETQSLETCHG